MIFLGGNAGLIRGVTKANQVIWTALPKAKHGTVPFTLRV